MRSRIVSLEMDSNVTAEGPYAAPFPELTDGELRQIIRHHLGGPLERFARCAMDRAWGWRDGSEMMEWYGRPDVGRVAVAPDLSWWGQARNAIAIRLRMALTEDRSHFDHVLGLATREGFTLRNTPWTMLEPICEVLLSVQVAGLLAGVRGQSEAEVLTEHAKSRRLRRGLNRIIRAHANGRISTRDAAKEMRELRIVDRRWRLPRAQCRAPLERNARLRMLSFHRRESYRSELRAATALRRHPTAAATARKPIN